MPCHFAGSHSARLGRCFVHRNAAQTAAEVEMVPELGRHNTAKTQTIEAAKSAARAFTLDTLAVGLDLFHVEIPGPLEALLAEEFAHKGRRIDKETIRQWGFGSTRSAACRSRYLSRKGRRSFQRGWSWDVNAMTSSSRNG